MFTEASGETLRALVGLGLAFPSSEFCPCYVLLCIGFQLTRPRDTPAAARFAGATGTLLPVALEAREGSEDPARALGNPTASGIGL
ncbi:hypothetical protein P7K49_032711 [Saguinus oedipus]|uniref:Uncharacterized protein n=1 Tax=Saguinus oedipus TaxID=9490 RepID=A0ABQ9TPU7_SAGOE|nr:hypothetical protein P7K49_032711 [Saguinus oedipus]